MLILDLWGISFHAAIVFALGKNLLFKSVLGHCVLLCIGTIEFEKVFSIYGSEMTSIADTLESNRNSGRIPLLCFSVRNS